MMDSLTPEDRDFFEQMGLEKSLPKRRRERRWPFDSDGSLMRIGREPYWSEELGRMVDEWNDPPDSGQTGQAAPANPAAATESVPAATPAAGKSSTTEPPGGSTTLPSFLILALVFAVLSGVLPAWRMSRLDPAAALSGRNL